MLLALCAIISGMLKARNHKITMVHMFHGGFVRPIHLFDESKWIPLEGCGRF